MQWGVPTCRLPYPVQSLQRRPDAQADDGTPLPLPLMLSLMQFNLALEFGRGGQFINELGLVAAIATGFEHRIRINFIADNRSPSFCDADRSRVHPWHALNGPL